MTKDEINTLAIELINAIGNERSAAVGLINHLKIHYDIVQKKYGIKDACSWLNKADQEVVARNNYFYSAETNEVLIEVKLNEDGSGDKKTNGR
jgi:hypothetical protein